MKRGGLRASPSLMQEIIIFAIAFLILEKILSDEITH